MVTKKNIRQLRFEVREAKRRLDTADAKTDKAQQAAAKAERNLSQLTQQSLDAAATYDAAVRELDAARDKQ